MIAFMSEAFSSSASCMLLLCIIFILRNALILSGPELDKKYILALEALCCSSALLIVVLFNHMLVTCRLCHVIFLLYKVKCNCNGENVSSFI